MSSGAEQQPAKVEAIAAGDRPQPVSQELARLIAQLQDEFPHAEAISFEFRTRLRLHIDIRTLEEANVIEARLPALCGGIFSEIFTGSSPHHPFFHRVSALAAK